MVQKLKAVAKPVVLKAQSKQVDYVQLAMEKAAAVAKEVSQATKGQT